MPSGPRVGAVFPILAALTGITVVAACSDGDGTHSTFPGSSDTDDPTLDAGLTDVSAPTDGRQLVTLATPGVSYTLRVDSSNAYVIPGESILQIPLSGAPPLQLASVTSESGNVVVTGSYVYWADFGSGVADGVIADVPIGGGTVTSLAIGQGDPYAVTADSTSLYWANLAECPTPPTCGSAIVSMPLAGGTPVVLASALTTSPEAMAVDSSNVYWGTSDGRVMMLPKGGGTPTQIAYYETNVVDLVVSGSFVYWATNGGDVIQTPTGGGPSTAIVVGIDPIVGLALDSTSLYFATNNYPLSSVQKVALGGGAPETLWTGTDNPEAIQVDATSVYFTTTSGALNKLTPK
jgi:hypothetical protein